MSAIKILAIAALEKDTRAIGHKQKLLWKLPNDMARFKKLTQNKAVIMGSKTWSSLPVAVRPLPQRYNIVVSRNPDFYAPGAQVITSPQAALQAALAFAQENNSDEIFIIGGAQIYQSLLPITDRLYLTEVESNVKADSYFPDHETDFICKTESETIIDNGYNCKYLICERVTK